MLFKLNHLPPFYGFSRTIPLDVHTILEAVLNINLNINYAEVPINAPGFIFLRD